MATGVMLCQDADLLRFEPNLDQVFPRLDRNKQPHRDWGVQRKLASVEIERRFRARKFTGERFELGRLSDRTKEELTDAAANLSLHYVFIAADTQGDETGYFARKAAHYFERAGTIIDSVSLMIDYDCDNNGTIDKTEQSQPAPIRLIRG